MRARDVADVLRVAVNARLLTAPTLRGWNRYTLELLAELPGLGALPILYLDGPIHPSHLARLPVGGFELRESPPLRFLHWQNRWLPREVAKDRADVLHSPFNFGLPWSRPCPKVLTLHDAIDQRYPSGRVSWRGRFSPHTLRDRFPHWVSRTTADRVITVSEHARGDLIHHLGIPARKVVVTHEAADRRFHEPIGAAERSRVRGAHGLANRYVFFVGGWDRRKNIPFLVRAFAGAALDGVDLVLAGGKDEERAALVELARELGLADRLRLLGFVEDDALPALYAEALAFAYPSEYEGFGLQLCEAMATGCPTLASRATCLPEVLGDGGETFGLETTAELSALLRRLAVDEGFRDALSARARARSAAFSWRRTAEQTVAVYRAAIDESRR